MNFPPGPAADPPAPKPNSKVPAAPQPEPAPRPNIAELFTAFAAISLSGFGGVLAWARRIMVEKRRWLTAEQATAELRVSRQTLYAYVSRGRIGVTTAPDELNRGIVRQLTQQTHQRSAMIVAARFARNEINDHSSVAPAVSAAKSKVMRAIRLRLQRNLLIKIVLSTRADSFRYIYRQFQCRCCLKPRDARFAAGCRAFDK